MANLLLFRKKVLAVTAAVLTLSAPGDVTLKLNPAQSPWPNLLFRTTPDRILPENAAMALSATDVSVSQAPVTITIENAQLALSAQSPTIVEVLQPENAVLALSAQNPTLVAAAASIAVENAVLALSGADIGITEDLRGVLVYINGVNRSDICQLDAQSMEHEAQGRTGTLAINVNGNTGFVPASWMEVQVYQGSVANVQFGGVIQEIELLFPKGDLSRVDYRLDCSSYEALFSRKLIFARYQSQSVSTTAAAIIAQVPGFTAAVQAGLPVIDDIEFIGVPATEALAQLASKIGATSFVGSDKRAHLALTETTDAPDPLSAASPYRELTVKRNSKQLRNRVIAFGKSHPVTADVAAASTFLPVRDVDEYPASGTVQVGSRVLTFASKSANAGQGSTVDGPLVAPAAPAAVQAAPAVSAPPIGSLRYAVSHVIQDRGETEISALTSPVVIAPMGDPVAGTGIAQNSDSGMSVVLQRSGTQLTIVSGLSFTLLPGAKVRLSGTSSNAFDGVFTIASWNAFDQPVIGGVSSVGPSSSGATLYAITCGPHLTTKNYRLTYESSSGSTLGGTVFSAAGNNFNAPGAGVFLSGSGGGGLTPFAIYRYWIGWVTDRGVTGFQWIGTAIMGSNTAIDLSNLPTSSDSRSNGRALFRDRAGTEIPRMVASLDNTSTTYRDVTADSALGELPNVGECGSAIGLYGLPISADPRCARRGLYRFDPLTGTYRRAATLDNVTRWFFDAVDDSSLGEVLPSVSEFGGAAVDVTVSTVPAGTTVTKIWRTKDAGSAPFLLGTIPNGGIGTLRDTRADDDLNEPAPATSKLTTLPGATAVRVKSGTPFAGGGWARTGSQVIQFAATSGNQLTGVPATGPGSITAPIPADAEIVVEPHLRGVTGLATAITVGEEAHVRAQVDDAASQAALASGSDDGVREHKIENSEWSYATALLAAQADLALNKTERIVITFKRDGYKDIIGKTIEVNLPSLGIVSLDDFTINNVSVSELARFRKRYAERTVTISNAPLLSFDDYLRRLIAQAA